MWVGTNCSTVHLLQIPDYRNAVIVAKNPNAVKRATSYAERLRLGIAVIHGEEKVSDSDADDGRSSPPLPDEESRTKQGMEFFPGAFYLHKFTLYLLLSWKMVHIG